MHVKVERRRIWRVKLTVLPECEAVVVVGLDTASGSGTRSRLWGITRIMIDAVRVHKA
jgi:hypothetical protein